MKKNSEILTTAEKQAIKWKKINTVLFVLLLISVMVNYLLVKGII